MRQIWEFFKSVFCSFWRTAWTMNFRVVVTIETMRMTSFVYFLPSCVFKYQTSSLKSPRFVHSVPFRSNCRPNLRAVPLIGEQWVEVGDLWAEIWIITGNNGPGSDTRMSDRHNQGKLKFVNKKKHKKTKRDELVTVTLNVFFLH